MSKQQAVLRIWDDHWSTYGDSDLRLIQSRFTREAFRKIDAFLDGHEGSILEVGCGTGRFSALFACAHPNAVVTGIDLSEKALQIACRIKSELRVDNLSLIKTNLFDLPFTDACFDIVFSEGVISHFDMEGNSTHENALSEMVRVVKPGGKVILSVPNWYCVPHTAYKWLLRRLGRAYEYGYEKSFKREELSRLFRERSLVDVEFSGFYPAHAFYRLVGYSRLFRLAGSLIDILEQSLGSIRMDWLSRIFGFQIIAVGSKEQSAKL